jgi:hypothetical protein
MPILVLIKENVVELLKVSYPDGHSITAKHCGSG